MSTVAAPPPQPPEQLGFSAARVAIGAWLVFGGFAAGLIGGTLAFEQRGAAIPALGLIVLLVLIWKKPGLSPVLLLLAGLSIEQFRYTAGTHSGAFTDRIPFFQGVGGNIHVNPADLTLLLLVSIWVLRTNTSSVGRFPRGGVATSIVALLLAVLVGLAEGQRHHGALRISLTEIRPYIYLAVTFALAAVFITTRSLLRACLWVLVLGSGFKALLGLMIFAATRNERPRPEAILGHEEALFFGLFILLTVALWIYGVRGRLRMTATILLPFVLAADLANHRRTAWLILGAGLVVLGVLAFGQFPERRRQLTRAAVAIGIVSAIYLPVYWNHTGALAGPARAVHSAISPDTRDASSDLYRVQENANLRLNIRRGGLFGLGFGVPINYALPITDLRDIDPLITYIPHNGVLYILMRMGMLGGIAFWALLATGIIGACRLARSRERELAVVGALLAAGLVGYALEGALDQGFFLYRIAFVIGSLLGLAEAARRLDAEGSPATS